MTLGSCKVTSRLYWLPHSALVLLLYRLTSSQAQLTVCSSPTSSVWVSSLASEWSGAAFCSATCIVHCHAYYTCTFWTPDLFTFLLVVASPGRQFGLLWLDSIATCSAHHFLRATPIFSIARRPGTACSGPPHNGFLWERRG